MAEVIIGGDFSPLGSSQGPAVRGEAEALFHDLVPVFRESDCAVVNLETPLIEKESPVAKTGPVLGAPPGIAAGLVAAGIDLVNLANNHVMDHGAAGLENTLRVCRSRGIEMLGAGENLLRARDFVIREYSGLRVAFAAMAEHEFSIAGPETPGANPLDLVYFLQDLAARSGEWDYLVVLLHAGVEHFPYPTPRLRTICRFLAERGVDAVICQHTHCAGCWEKYEGAFLVYGQGNLLFDFPVSFPEWHRGFLVSLDIDSSGKAEMELIPHTRSDPPPGIRRMEGDEKAVFLAGIEERSKAVKDDNILRNRWEDYCREMEYQYLNGLHGYGTFLGRVNRKLGIPRVFRSRRSLLATLNHIRCESHREALLTILEGKIRDDGFCSHKFIESRNK